MAELADARDLGSRVLGRGGSSPPSRTPAECEATANSRRTFRAELTLGESGRHLGRSRGRLGRLRLEAQDARHEAQQRDRSGEGADDSLGHGPTRERERERDDRRDQQEESRGGDGLVERIIRPCGPLGHGHSFSRGA